MSHFTSSVIDGVEIEFDRDKLIEVEFRREAWILASELLEPLVERHGLDVVRVGPAPFGSTPAQISKVEQHHDLILELADWLLGNGA